MARATYLVNEVTSEIVNTKDVCQWADSPRWTPSFCAATTCTIHCYDEWSDTIGGPTLTNEFQIIKDDLILKYGADVSTEAAVESSAPAASNSSQPEDETQPESNP